MRTLIVLSGMPGSGKSTWAKGYLKEHPSTRWVASDEIRKEFFGIPNCFEDEDRVWKTFCERLTSDSEKNPNFVAIADATTLTNALRMRYYHLTEDFDRHILVLFKIQDYEAQNKQREPNRIVPEYAMDRMRGEYEEPNDEVKHAFEIHVITHFSPDGPFDL